jgi:hypothetical protein
MHRIFTTSVASVYPHYLAKADFATFFGKAPKLNPACVTITGVICGMRFEAIENPLMREIRYLDKLIDELATGRPMAKILRVAGSVETR